MQTINQQRTLTGNQLKREGQQAALFNAGDAWKEHVMAAFKGWLSVRKDKGNKPFAIEEFRAFCEAWGIDTPTHQAWGGLTGGMVKANLIRWRKGEFKQAESVKTHGHYVKIYEAL